MAWRATKKRRDSFLGFPSRLYESSIFLRLLFFGYMLVGVCQECGQRYYAAATLDRLDAMAQNSDTAPERISVPVKDRSYLCW